MIDLARSDDLALRRRPARTRPGVFRGAGQPRLRLHDQHGLPRIGLGRYSRPQLACHDRELAIGRDEAVQHKERQQPAALTWIIHPMSYCAARLHAISGRPRSSFGDTIPSGATIRSCPQRLLRSSLRVARSAWGHDPIVSPALATESDESSRLAHSARRARYSRPCRISSTNAASSRDRTTDRRRSTAWSRALSASIPYSFKDWISK